MDRMDFAKIIKNAFEQVIPYSVLPMIENGCGYNYGRECNTSCNCTAITLASVFGKDAMKHPGEIHPGYENPSPIDAILMNDIVLFEMFPANDHAMCTIIKDNVFYMCESLQDQYGLQIMILTRHTYMTTIANFGTRIQLVYDLDLNVMTNVRRIKQLNYTDEELEAIKKCKKESKDYPPRITDCWQ